MSTAVRAARAIWRGYYEGSSKRAGQVRRLHVIRDKPVGEHYVRARPALRLETWCGQGAGSHQHSGPAVLDPMPARPPDGLEWCPKCIGHLAEWYGLLDEVAASLAAYDPGLVT